MPGMLVISLQQQACGPCESFKRAGMFQTWTVCGSFPFLRPKGLQHEAVACQSQLLISKTWLHLRNAGPWPSAHPIAKTCFCRAAYLYGMLEAVLPSRKHGKTRSGTHPRRSSTLPTYRVVTEEGSYSFLTPFDSIVPVVCRWRSSKALKKTRSRGISYRPEIWRLYAKHMTRVLHYNYKYMTTVF